MKDSAALFQLIHSLSGPEKRHFKLQSSSYSGNKNYLKVFDVMAAQKKYNEAALRKKLNDKTLLKQLPRIKNYLYQHILKSIRTFYTGENLSSVLKQHADQADQLISKGLTDQALKLILRSKKTAYKIENFYTLIDLLKQERKIRVSRLEFLQIDRLHEETQHAWKHLNNSREYVLLKDRMFSLFIKEGRARSEKTIKEVGKIMKHPLLQHESGAINYDSLYSYYSIHSNYAELKGDMAECYRYRKLLIDLFHRQPFRLRENQGDYIIAVNNLLRTIDLNERPGETMEYIRLLQKLTPANIIHASWIFTYSHISEAGYYNTIGEFEKGAFLDQEINKGLDRFRQQMAPAYRYILLANLALLHFGSGNYSKSLSYLNQALNMPGVEYRKDADTLIRIFYLIVHYELSNEQLLPYLVRSTYRHLLKRESAYKYEDAILQYLRKLPRLSTPRKIRESFTELKSELMKLQSDPFEKQAFQYFDMISWLESKLERKSFAEIVKRKFGAGLQEASAKKTTKHG